MPQRLLGNLSTLYVVILLRTTYEDRRRAPLHTTHATYLPDRYAFALWTWTGRAPGPAPQATDERVRLAVPTPDGTALTVTEVDCSIVDAEHLGEIHIPDAGISVPAWRRVAVEYAGPEVLPPAAHAVANATASAIVSADQAVRAFRDTEGITRALRAPLRATLRSYQARGISWLYQATAEHGGAVLADEMGLGKTVQAIGFLIGRAESGPQLVVCPTSLVGNWVHEITRFAPGLRPLAWRGGALGDLAPGTVLVTGYPTLRGHGPVLAGRHWRRSFSTRPRC